MPEYRPSPRLRTGRVVVAALLVMALLGSVAQARELQIRFHRQHTQVWCWAATIAMVLEYVKGTSLEDCQVLSVYDRSLNGPGICCQQPFRCNRTGSTAEMGHIMQNLFGMQGVYLRRALTMAEIKTQIDNRRPIIAGFHHARGGHVVVVSGYGPGDKIIVLDPLFGKYQVPYQTILRNGRTGVWAETFVIQPGKTYRRPISTARRGPSVGQRCCTPYGVCPMPWPARLGVNCYCVNNNRRYFGVICR